MTARYAIADIEYAEAVQILDRLPPGHHHVHVTEDGTITAVPMRVQESIVQARWPNGRLRCNHGSSEHCTVTHDHEEPWTWVDATNTSSTSRGDTNMTAMTDIVDRLRGLDEGIDGHTDRVVLEAANEIERLRAENEERWCEIETLHDEIAWHEEWEQETP